jgi:oxygen-independent coproporphyrinogen-3 oxidase
MQVVHKWFHAPSGAEITVEANPLDVTPQKIQILVDARVNRLSLGIQSFNCAKLAALDRDHTVDQAFRSIEIARRGIPNLSIDLIFAAPGETSSVWQADLDHALRLGLPHISAYSLTYERGAAFWSLRRRGTLETVDEQIERWMYEFAIDTLTANCLEHYEVSSFARAGYRSVHNQVYWNGGEYYAAGPGASRHIDGRRETNHRSTSTYLKRVLSGLSPVAESESLDAEMRARERLVFGLRQIRGVSLDEFERATGYRLQKLVGRQLARLRELELVELTESSLKLTRNGLMVSDSIMAELLS